jgi:4-amino-4-deoxy-L-arabinose transferase-like glycosyltransferase
MLTWPVSRLVMAMVLLVALFVGIDNMERPLANPDEGRYSEISREMALSGDWVTPRLNGIKYFEKPPLQYWGTAIAFKLFGENEYSARLYVALCGLATILLVGFTATRLLGIDIGIASMFALLSSPYFLALGGIVTLDMGLTLWTTATFCALLLSEQSVARPREQRNWMLAAWVSMALAVLSKGLVGIVFAGAAVFLWMVVHRDLKILARMRWGLGLAIFVAIAAPWFVAVSSANPEFAHFFFVHEHLERFLTKVHRRVSPWWYFIPIVAAGFLMWTFALPGAIAAAWKREPGFARDALRVTLLWALLIVAFFSTSGSKLPAYVLPAFPPLAIALGAYIASAPERRLAIWTFLAFPAAAVLGWYAWHLPDTARDAWSRTMYVAAQPWAEAAAATFLAAVIVVPLLFWRRHRWMAAVTVCVATMVLISFLEDAYEEFSPRQSSRDIAELTRPVLTPGTRLYSVEHYEQSYPFYIARTVRLVSYVDEFEEGLKSEPALGLTIEAFVADWQRPGDAVAIMHPDSYRRMQSRALPMQVLHDDPRRVLVRKP